MRDELGVPDAVEVVGHRSVGASSAGGRTKRGNQNTVSAALDTERVKWLVNVTDEMYEKLERDGAICTVERNIGKAFLVVGDAVDGAVAPAIATTTGSDSGLSRAVTIAIVARGIGQNVEVVPERSLVVAVEIRTKA